MALGWEPTSRISNCNECNTKTNRTEQQLQSSSTMTTFAAIAAIAVAFETPTDGIRKHSYIGVHSDIGSGATNRYDNPGQGMAATP